MCVPVSRQLQDVAPQGGGLVAATILFLSLAWSGIDPQGAEAVYDIPYQVTIFLQILFGRAICLHLYQQFNDV